jgi:hypothetical protein
MTDPWRSLGVINCTNSVPYLLLRGSIHMSLWRSGWVSLVGPMTGGCHPLRLHTCSAESLVSTCFMSSTAVTATSTYQTHAYPTVHVPPQADTAAHPHLDTHTSSDSTRSTAAGTTREGPPPLWPLEAFRRVQRMRPSGDSVVVVVTVDACSQARCIRPTASDGCLYGVVVQIHHRRLEGAVHGKCAVGRHHSSWVAA